MLSDQHLRDAVEAARLGTWDFHPQTGVLVGSQRCKQMLGLAPEAAFDYGVFLRAVHIDDRARVSQAVQRALTAGAGPQLDIEYRVDPGSSGAARWLRAIATAQFDDAGVPVRLLGAVVEITERKQRELQERRLGQIAENSADFIGYASPDGKSLYLNPAGLALVGVDDVAAVLGREMIDFFMPEDQPRLRSEILPAVMRTGRWVGEFRFRHFRTGRAVPVHYDLSRIDDPTTRALQGYATVAVDRTGRRGEGEHHFLADSVPQLLSTVNHRGEITYVNRRMREFTGRTQEELNQHASELVHRDDLDRVRAAWDGAVASGRTYRLEFRLRRRDGEYRWLLMEAMPQWDADGTVLQWVRACTDIHDVKQTLEDRHERAVDDLERALAAAKARITELEAAR